MGKFYSKSPPNDDFSNVKGIPLKVKENWRSYLSNFSFLPKKTPLRVFDQNFYTPEHAYQYAKCNFLDSHENAMEFTTSGSLDTPAKAKQRGGKIRGSEAREAIWSNSLRKDKMKEILEARFEHDKIFERILRAVHTKKWYLLHESENDRYWGGKIDEETGVIQGENVLGKLMMNLVSQKIDGVQLYFREEQDLPAGGAVSGAAAAASVTFSSMPNWLGNVAAGWEEEVKVEDEDSDEDACQEDGVVGATAEDTRGE